MKISHPPRGTVRWHDSRGFTPNEVVPKWHFFYKHLKSSLLMRIESGIRMVVLVMVIMMKALSRLMQTVITRSRVWQDLRIYLKMSDPQKIHDFFNGSLVRY